jgi:competence protein ComEC
MYLRVLENAARPARPSTERKASFQASRLEVRMFNVGAGEAVLLTFPDGRAWLVGAGCEGSNQSKILANGLLAYLDANPILLDTIVMTHPHSDHAEAVTTILRGGPAAVAPKVTIYRRAHATWRGTGWRDDLQAVIDAAGNRIRLQEWDDDMREFTVSQGVTARFFVGTGSTAYTSMFLQLQFHDARLLFTGDAKCKYETKLLKKYKAERFRADILKVTHHGSSTGTACSVVAAAKPGLAIASTGSRGGHTLEYDTIQRLGGLNSRRMILETAYDGDIVLRTDGRAYGKGVLYDLQLPRKDQFADALKLPVERAPKKYEPSPACEDC